MEKAEGYSRLDKGVTSELITSRGAGGAEWRWKGGRARLCQPHEGASVYMMWIWRGFFLAIFFGHFFLAIFFGPTACTSFRVRDQTCTVAVTQVASVTTQDP